MLSKIKNMFVSSIIKNVLISSKMNDDRKPRSDTNGEGESEVTETSTPQGEKDTKQKAKPIRNKTTNRGTGG
jgi:hypothetical protein